MEEWREVIGFEGLYQVSSMGRVRSVDRYLTLKNGQVRHYKGRIRKQHTDGRGHYMMVSLLKIGFEVTARVGRLVAIAFLGLDPEDGTEIDHRDLNKQNDSVENIRICNRSQNNSNRATPPSNTSGAKGVRFNKKSRRFQARLKVNGKEKFLGCFDSMEAAVSARQAGAIKYHGEFARF